MRRKLDFLFGIVTVLFGSAALAAWTTIVMYPIGLMIVQTGVVFFTAVMLLVLFVACLNYLVNFDVYNR